MRAWALLTAVLLPAAAPLAASAPDAPAPVPGLEAGAGMSDTEKLKRGAAELVRMRRAVRDASAEHAEARRTKDVMKLTCVDEKLPALRTLLQVAEGAEAALRTAVGARAAVDSQHAYAKVALASQKMNALRTELERCLGRLAFRTEEGVSVEVEKVGEGRDAPQAEDPTTN